MTDYRRLSLWHDSAEEDWGPRPPLAGDLDVDVAVIGAGYTGLWTAYYLAQADRTLRVAVLEREVAGFGASGRNGGWCSGLFPAPLAWLAKRYGGQPAVAQHRAVQQSVDEIGRVCEAEDIDCHFAKGGTLSAARTRLQLARAEAEVSTARRWGFGPEDITLLDAASATGRISMSNLLGATYTPHCAAIQPTRLVRGLARAVERHGVSVYEQTPVTRIGPGWVTTPHGRVRAETVVRATEGFTAQLPGHRRTLVPVYSLMVATEPLPQPLWDTIGLAERETFTDYRHLIVYGQRTADGRLAFGGRGAPYHLGSRTDPAYDHDPSVFEGLRRTLVELFPALRDVAFTHAWGGPLGIPRDWCPSVGLDRATGLAWAGGYVGDGVATSNLAGRTLADLVLRRDSDLVRLPWVGHRSRQWEPEPARWAGVSATLNAMKGADAEEERTGRPSRRAALLTRLLGH